MLPVGLQTLIMFWCNIEIYVSSPLSLSLNLSVHFFFFFLSLPLHFSLSLPLLPSWLNVFLGTMRLVVGSRLA